MPRPKKCRYISTDLPVTYFKPQGVPMRFLQHVALTMDEAEALKLADLEGLSQEEAAKHMNVSRATFGRIAAQARFKTADAIINGKAIRIEGGEVQIKAHPGRHGRGWSRNFGSSRIRVGESILE